MKNKGFTLIRTSLRKNLDNARGFTLIRTSLRKNLDNARGFTLIELLVVISIIAVLAGLSLFALQGARESARDARRKADLEQIRSALELYKADCGDYPAALPAVGNALVGDGSPSACSASNTYMAARPGDIITGQLYVYRRITTTTYEICTSLEGGTVSVSCNGSSSCGTGTCYYRVTNP